MFLQSVAKRLSNARLQKILEGAEWRRRAGCLRALGVAFGEGSAIHPPFRAMNCKPKALKDFLSVGEKVYVGADCLFDLKEKITIGNRVTLAYRVAVITHWDPGSSRLAQERPPSRAPVTLKDDCYIGTNATILPGVTVGAGSIVAAGAVVTKDVPDGVLVAGVPAKVIGPVAK